MRWLHRAWVWWGHLNDAQALLAILGAAVVVASGAFGVRVAPAEVLRYASAALAAAGVAALCLIAYFYVVSKLRLLPPPRWIHPSDDELAFVQRALDDIGEEFAADNPSAPILRWLDPGAELVGLREHVSVWCENNGPLESVAVVLSRWAEMSRPDESAPWEPMEFEEFNVPSYIRSVLGADNRRFLVKIRASHYGARELGTKLVRWSVIYKDAMLRHGYLTSCSMLVNFDRPGRAQVLSTALDATSTLAERNRRYREWIAKHGEPST